MFGFLSGARSGGAPRAAPAKVERLHEGLRAEAEHEKCEDTYADNVLTDNVDETWNSGRMATPQNLAGQALTRTCQTPTPDLDELNSRDPITALWPEAFVTPLVSFVCQGQEPVCLDITLGPEGGEGKLVDKLVLMPYQVPTPALTHHRVWLDGQLVAELRGTTTHHKPLPDVLVGKVGKRLRIETLESPSWVAWSQVQVWGAGSE